VIEDAARLADNVAKHKIDSLKMRIDPCAAFAVNAFSNRFLGTTIDCLLGMTGTKSSYPAEKRQRWQAEKVAAYVSKQAQPKHDKY